MEQNSLADFNLDAFGVLRWERYGLDPYAFHLCRIPWHLFWTSHYKGDHYWKDTAEAEGDRRRLITSILNRSRVALGLASNDLQFFGVTEKKWGRCHTHTLIYIKPKAGNIADEVRKAVLANIPWEIMAVEKPATKSDAIELVRDSGAASRYISKMNGNEMEIRANHFSRCFKQLLSLY